MNFTSDPQILLATLILPGFFGISLIGQGVSRLMNYDSHGWIGIVVGSCFILLILLIYFSIVTKIF